LILFLPCLAKPHRPGAALKGCLSAKNNQPKTARNDECANRFIFEMLFYLFIPDLLTLLLIGGHDIIDQSYSQLEFTQSFNN